MPGPVETDVEKRLSALMAGYGDPGYSFRIQSRIKELVMRMQFENVPYEILAFSIAQHAAACVASMKMMGAIRPELADLLAQDFTDTVHRAFPGTTQLGNKQ